jgi:hypothetical protein
MTQVQKEGLAYEKRVARALREMWEGGILRHGPWLWFLEEADLSGPPEAPNLPHRAHWVQPDILWEGPRGLVVVECKRTETPEAWEQLQRYCAVVKFLWKMPVRGIQVVRNLGPESPKAELGPPSLELPHRSLVHWTI